MTPNASIDKSLQAVVRKGLPTDVSPEAINHRLNAARIAIREFINASRRDNTERSYEVGIRFFWAWAWMSFGVSDIKYPVPQEIIEVYIINLLSGMDAAVDQAMVEERIKRAPGALKLSTVQSRLWALGRAHREYCPEIADAYVRTNKIKNMIRAAGDLSENAPSQSDALTLNHLIPLLNVLKPDTHRNTLLRSVITTGFASGGRRISELVNLQTGDCKRLEVTEAPGWMYTLSIRGTKTHRAGDDAFVVPVRGRPAIYLADWFALCLQRNIDGGSLFRAVRPDGGISKKGMSAEWLYKRIRELAREADLRDSLGVPLRITPHSLRSGFVTQCGIDGIAPGDGMALTGHASIACYSRYYRTGEIQNNPAGNLL